MQKNLYLLIHNNLVEKEIELTPENPVVYVYMKRKGGTNIKDVTIEYCKEVKPYINNVSAGSINVSSLKPKFEIPDSLFYGFPIIAVQVVSLLLLIMGSTDEFIGIIINVIAIVMAIVNMVRATKELSVAKKLEIDNYHKFHSAIRITNFLYIMSILVEIGLLAAFIIILIK